MAKVSPFAARLAKMQKTFQNTEPATGGEGFVNEAVSNGAYTSKLAVCPTLCEVADKLAIRWDYEITDGDCAGERVQDLSFIETDQNCAHLKKRISKFGYETENIDLKSQLEELLEAIFAENKLLKINVKTTPDGQYQNVFLNEVLEETAEEVEAEPEPEEEAPAKPAKKTTAAAPAKPAGLKKKTEAEPEPEAADANDSEEVSFNKGDVVEYHNPKFKAPITVTIKSVNDDAKTCTVKGPKNEIFEKVKFDHLSAAGTADEEEVPDEEELEVGARVQFKDQKTKKIVKGRVTEIDEADEEATIKIDGQKNSVSVSFGEITILEE